MDRRQFLVRAAVTAGAAAVGTSVLGGTPALASTGSGAPARGSAGSGSSSAKSAEHFLLGTARRALA